MPPARPVAPECSFGVNDFSHARLRHTHLDSVGFASLQDSALMTDVDWKTPPDLQEIFKDSSNSSFKKYSGYSWYYFVQKMKEISTQPVDPESPRPTGITVEAYLAILPSIACRGHYIGFGVLRNCSACTNEEKDMKQIATTMCQSCPDTLAKIIHKWPGEMEPIQHICK
jgi:hypothetical protein